MNKSSIRVMECDPDETLSLRMRYRLEMNCQIVHDSIHQRGGWTRTYLLYWNEQPAGFATIAIAGPWREKPTFLEFYLVPEHRAQAFAFFESFLETGKPQFLEVQTNDSLAFVMAMTYGRDVETESIVFQDCLTTDLPGNGATIRPKTDDAEVHQAMHERQGGGEWELEIEGKTVGKGGILFHYNAPYGDIYMEIDEEYRRRGLGAFLIQELKKAAYRLGAVPAARCSPVNIASRRTLQRAGFEPYAHLMNGKIREDRSAMKKTV